MSFSNEQLGTSIARQEMVGVHSWSSVWIAIDATEGNTVEFNAVVYAKRHCLAARRFLSDTACTVLTLIVLEVV